MLETTAATRQSNIRGQVSVCGTIGLELESTEPEATEK